jgi:hypothetical protein
VQAVLGFPAQLLLAQAAGISGAAPVNATLTLYEYESKVNGYLCGASPRLHKSCCTFEDRTRAAFFCSSHNLFAMP